MRCAVAIYNKCGYYVLVAAVQVMILLSGDVLPFYFYGFCIMLEQKISDLTAAVRELTAAVKIIASQQSAACASASVAPVSSSVPPAAYGTAGTGEVTAALAAADGLSGINPDAVPSEVSAPAAAPAAAQAVPAQGTASASAGAAPSQPVAPAESAAAPEAAAMTLEQLRSFCIRAGQAGLTTFVIEFLRAHGVSMLSDLPAKYYGELVAALSAKGVQ